MKEVRPTSGKVLLALMSILGGRLSNIAFLDLFAGTGRVGIEALNRGAGPVIFVETLKERANKIIKSVPKTHQDISKVLNFDIRRALSWLEKKNESFDIIFADPPYNEGWGKELLKIAEEHIGLFKPGGVFIFEHSDREAVSPGSILEMKDSRKYGETILTFFERRDS